MADLPCNEALGVQLTNRVSATSSSMLLMMMFSSSNSIHHLLYELSCAIGWVKVYNCRISSFGTFISPVHVVLVSLLVDQLSSLFLSFFGRPKKICSVSGNFWSGSDFFWSTKFLFGVPKIPRDWPKIPWDWTIFFLVDQKKWEKDRTIGWPRDWPKPHGRDYLLGQARSSRLYSEI